MPSVQPRLLQGIAPNIRDAERAVAGDGRRSPADRSKYMRPGLDFAVGKAVEEAGEFLAAMGGHGAVG